MLHALENSSLADRVLDLTELANVLLLEDFHSVVLFSLLVEDEKYFAVCAFAEHFKLRKVPDAGLMRPRLHFADHVLVAFVALL